MYTPDNSCCQKNSIIVLVTYSIRNTSTRKNEIRNFYKENEGMKSDAFHVPLSDQVFIVLEMFKTGHNNISTARRGFGVRRVEEGLRRGVLTCCTCRYQIVKVNKIGIRPQEIFGRLLLVGIGQSLVDARHVIDNTLSSGTFNRNHLYKINPTTIILCLTKLEFISHVKRQMSHIPRNFISSISLKMLCQWGNYILLFNIHLKLSKRVAIRNIDQM